MLILVVAAMLGATQPAMHEATLEHRGVAYQLSYRPHVSTQMRTIGQSVGSRPSTERCRWTATVALEREIRRASDGERLTKRVPGDAHVIEGQRPGSCRQVGQAVEAEIASRVERAQDAVLAMAQADRPAVIADIDAAHALALN